MTTPPARRPGPALTLALLSALLPGCATPPHTPERYLQAVRDAANPEPGEVVHTLTAIRPDNPALSWKTLDGAPHVLMASLAFIPPEGDRRHYRENLGKAYKVEGEIWVTAAPEVKNRCAGYGQDPLPRLRQLLGLTPTAAKSDFVQFWVKPEDLFRPAPDKEIDDASAGLNLPGDAEAWYRQWFNELRARQYHQSIDPPNDAYPWTQLGYTYDWGNPASEVGVSEFVIKPGAEVAVESVAPIGEYCRWP